MNKKSLYFAFAATVFSFIGEAKADYVLNITGLTPSSYTAPGGGSTFTFAVPANPQTGTDGFAQSFNVINVGLPTASGTGSGSTTLSENFTITGTGSTPGFVSGTLTGTFTVTGAISSFSGSITGLTGTGFSVGSINYAQPSPGSQTGSPTSGNISFVITPTAVPEPASVAMVGLGLASIGGLALRRRRAN